MTRSARTEPLAFHDMVEVADALREAGGRFSASRRLVLESLFAADGPLSAERIAHGAGSGATAMDAATVYRILERFEDLGVVRHVHLGHGPGLYALTRDGGREYLVCDACDRVTAVEPSRLDGVRALVRESFGFEASFTHFPMVGLCASCTDARRIPHPTPGATMSEHDHPHDRPHDEAHSHEHTHDDVTHSHQHVDHDHDHFEHEHEHEHDDVTHTHPHVHEAGLEHPDEDAHGHDHG